MSKPKWRWELVTTAPVSGKNKFQQVVTIKLFRDRAEGETDHRVIYFDQGDAVQVATEAANKLTKLENPNETNS